MLGYNKRLVDKLKDSIIYIKFNSKDDFIYFAEQVKVFDFRWIGGELLHEWISTRWSPSYCFFLGVVESQSNFGWCDNTEHLYLESNDFLKLLYTNLDYTPYLKKSTSEQEEDIDF